RQVRLTDSPGGALIGRDRSLQCETVSKAIFWLAHAGGGGGGGGPKASIRMLSLWADPPIAKRGPLLRPVPKVVFPHRCRPSLGGSFVQPVPPPVSEAQATLLAGRK